MDRQVDEVGGRRAGGGPRRRGRRVAGALPLLGVAAALVWGPVPDAEAQFQLTTPFATRYGKNKVTYDTFNFWVYKAPHFDVYYYPEEEAHLDEVVAFSEHAYRLISAKLNHDLSERTPIIFYQTHAEFEQTHIVPFFLPEGVAAFAEPTQDRLVLPVDDPPDELRKLIIHEVTHIFEYDFLYGSDVGRAIRVSPPGWVMEGLAEHMADNLTSLDEMLLRDVVLSDSIPTLVQMTYSRGFFIDYVLGQVVWDYIEEEYGTEGLRIFVSEIRRDLGQDIERDLQRAFNVTPQEFNNQFRAYLRARYLPDVLERDEAEDFAAEVFAGIPRRERPAAFSPVLSPDGREFAAISVNLRKLTLDVVRYDLATGRALANLSGKVRGQYEYIIGEGLTVGFEGGNDLSWSPDGRLIAFFGRTGPTRTLFVVDARSGELVYKKRLELDQALSPSIGPDGRVAFGAHRNGVRDIWIYDPRDDTLANLTQDELYDYAPVWSPDGRTVAFASHVLGAKKLFRIDLRRPQERVQLTFGLSNEAQPSFSPDGRILYFTSDRDGTYNLYGLDLASGRIDRYTDILHGAFFPQPLPEAEGKLLFSSFSDGSYHLFRMDLPDRPLESFAAAAAALPEEEVARLEQEIAEASTVELDEDNVSRSPSMGWHIEDIQVAGGIASIGGNATLLSSTAIIVSDLLGNHRIVGVLGSVSDQRNFTGVYLNLKRRLNWGVSGTSQRLFFFTIDPVNADIDRKAFWELDGAEFFASYPFNRETRVEFSAGYYDRQFALLFPLFTTPGEVLASTERFSNGTYLPLGVALVSDQARFREFGPFAGRRFRFDLREAPGVGDLQFTDVIVDWREYLQLTERSLVAVRYYGAFSTGRNPNVFFFGGLNQLRGFNFLQFSGSRATFVNVEYRFPFIDEIRGGELAIRAIRGTVFFDIGAAWFGDQDFKFFEDGRLRDAVASFGAGISFNLGPVPLNWYVAQRTDLRSLIGDLRLDFYIGPTF